MHGILVPEKGRVKAKRHGTFHGRGNKIKLGKQVGLLEILPRKCIMNSGGVSEVFIGYPRLVIGREKEVKSHDRKSYLI